MKRRRVLRGVLACPFVACGCISDAQNGMIEVEEKTFEATERRCVSSNTNSNSISTLHDQNTITVAGTIATPRRCLELSVAASATVSGRPDELFIHIFGNSNNRECEECPAEIEYQTTFKVNRMPEYVSIFHAPGGQGTESEYINRREIRESS